MTDDLSSIANKMEVLLDKFVDDGSISGRILPTEHEAKFKALAISAKGMIDEELAPLNDYSANLLSSVRAGSGGLFGGPSYALVQEAVEIVREAAQAIQRKQARSREQEHLPDSRGHQRGKTDAMSKTLETLFGTYTLGKLLGQGGAGRVYAGMDHSGDAVALKILTQPSNDKRKRFKNEINFLFQNRHKNIITVTDYGVSTSLALGPFYVMPLCNGSLRSVIDPDNDGEVALGWFSQILDGVEAAHLLGVVHRDLKPENVLIDRDGTIKVADFGVAHFTEEVLHTLVQTGAGQRLANFQYAAPEQRTPGVKVDAAADIYALGLMLNELFTGRVPHGTDYQTIEQRRPDFAFLDPIVAAMIRQNPADRPNSIAEVKHLILRHRAEAICLQRLSEINKTVIKAGDIDDPLAHEPPCLIDVDWNDGVLTLVLDRPVHPGWVWALQNMGNYSALYGRGPDKFSFRANVATVDAAAGEAQSIVDHFKEWLPRATHVLNKQLQTAAQREELRRRDELEAAKKAEEQRLALKRSIRI